MSSYLVLISIEVVPGAEPVPETVPGVMQVGFTVGIGIKGSKY
jgi:hypothetical protein